MRPDDPRAFLARDWLIRAARDLASSERLLLPPALPAEAAFHVQQAIEKALKCLLVWNNVSFAKTHDLDDLSERCATFAGDMASFRSSIAPLTRYGVETRYPGAEPEPPADEVIAALELARQVVQFVSDQLPPSVIVTMLDLPAGDRP